MKIIIRMLGSFIKAIIQQIILPLSFILGMIFIPGLIVSIPLKIWFINDSNECGFMLYTIVSTIFVLAIALIIEEIYEAYILEREKERKRKKIKN